MLNFETSTLSYYNAHFTTVSISELLDPIEITLALSTQSKSEREKHVVKYEKTHGEV